LPCELVRPATQVVGRWRETQGSRNRWIRQSHHGAGAGGLRVPQAGDRDATSAEGFADTGIIDTITGIRRGAAGGRGSSYRPCRNCYAFSYIVRGAGPVTVKSRLAF